jgi:hypothetical protein
MSPSAECGHWSIFTPSKTHGAKSAVGSAPQRQGLTLQRLDLGLQLGDPANVAMTMQSLLLPAADMPPDWLWAAMCRYCCKSRRGVTVEFKFETIESGRAHF